MNNLPNIFGRNDSTPNPFRSIAKMQQQMNRLFDRAWNTDNLELDLIPATEMVFSPVCNIDETDSHYLLSLDVPGLKKDDINIDVRGQTLTVSGERKEAIEQKKGNTYKSESSYGSFQRSFTLPVDVKADQVEAQYEHGVLRIAIPKTEATKAHKINISEGKTGIFGKLLGQKKEETKQH